MVAAMTEEQRAEYYVCDAFPRASANSFVDLWWILWQARVQAAQLHEAQKDRMLSTQVCARGLWNHTFT